MKIQPAKINDFKGKTVTLDQTFVVPKGLTVVRNATINVHTGASGIVGSSDMSAFTSNSKSGKLIVEKVRLQFKSDKMSAFTPDTSGEFLVEDFKINKGTIIHAKGFKKFELYGSYSEGTPKKYLCANFTHLGKEWILDFSGCPAQEMGDFEALIRLMQIDKSLIRYLKSRKLKTKQEFQDRPGGPKGSVYTQHTWDHCEAKLGDLGNFIASGNKSASNYDPNFPFGRVLLSRWIDCKIGGFHKTYGGEGAYGMRRVEKVIKGKTTAI